MMIMFFICLLGSCWSLQRTTTTIQTKANSRGLASSPNFLRYYGAPNSRASSSLYEAPLTDFDFGPSTDFGPHFDISQGASIVIFLGLGWFQYKIQTSIKIANDALAKREDLKKMVQQLQVEQLSMQEQETKIKRDKIAALETEIETLIEDEAKMRTFVSLPGVELRFRSPVQLQLEPGETDEKEKGKEMTTTNGTSQGTLNSDSDSYSDSDIGDIDNKNKKNKSNSNSNSNRIKAGEEEEDSLQPAPVLFSVLAVIALTYLLTILSSDPMSPSSRLPFMEPAAIQFNKINNDINSDINSNSNMNSNLNSEPL